MRAVTSLGGSYLICVALLTGCASATDRLESAGCGALTAMTDISAGCSDEFFSSLIAVNRFGLLREVRHIVAINLIGIEHIGCTRDAAGFKCGFVSFGSIILDGEFLVEDNEGGFLTFADLATLLLPLAIGSPCSGIEAEHLC